MSYTPPNTFVSGQVIAAADVQGNIDALQAYANGGVVQADLANTAWCQQEHIVAPEFNPVTNTLQAVSGAVSQAGRPTFTGRYTYAMRATSNTMADVEAYQWVPGTTQQIVVPRFARAILLQFCFGGTTDIYQNADVAAGVGKFGSPQTVVRAFLTSGDITDIQDLVGLSSLDQFTEHEVQILAKADSGSLNESHSANARRDHYSGFMLLENVTAGVYTFGLAAKSTNPKLRIFRWNVVAEAWMV